MIESSLYSFEVMKHVVLSYFSQTIFKVFLWSNQIHLKASPTTIFFIFWSSSTTVALCYRSYQKIYVTVSVCVKLRTTRPATCCSQHSVNSLTQIRDCIFLRSHFQTREGSPQYAYSVRLSVCPSVLSEITIRSTREMLPSTYQE